MDQRVRVLIADNQVHTRQGLQALLAVWPEIEVVGAVEHGAQVIHLVEECRPDVVLVVEIPTPGRVRGQGPERGEGSPEEMDGLEAIRLIKRLQPQVRIVVLMMYATHRAAACAAGADAFLLKGCPAQELLDAIANHAYPAGQA